MPFNENLVYTITETQKKLWRHLLTLIIIDLFISNIFNQLKDIEYFLGCVRVSPFSNHLGSAGNNCPHSARGNHKLMDGCPGAAINVHGHYFAFVRAH